MFEDFGRSELAFSLILEAPGVHFGGPGAHFEEFLDFQDFGDVFGAKAPPPFWSQNRSEIC